MLHSKKNIEARKDKHLLDYIEVLRKDNKELRDEIRFLSKNLDAAIDKNNELCGQLCERGFNDSCNKLTSLFK